MLSYLAKVYVEMSAADVIGMEKNFNSGVES